MVNKDTDDKREVCSVMRTCRKGLGREEWGGLMQPQKSGKVLEFASRGE